LLITLHRWLHSTSDIQGPTTKQSSTFGDADTEGGEVVLTIPEQGEAVVLLTKWVEAEAAELWMLPPVESIPSP
tara:strand:+ start:145 stop:366 length:222 start_codon:yes stop_codon:yes gene_type:complete